MNRETYTHQYPTGRRSKRSRLGRYFERTVASFGIALVGICIASASSQASDGVDPPPATQITSFAARAIDGKQVDIRSGNGLTVICFLGTECPLARLYGPRLQQLKNDFEQVEFIAFMSNQQDAVEEIARFISEHDIQFPIVKDTDNKFADIFAAERTPEVFVLDAELRVRYRGRIDDQYLPGIARTKPERQDLRLAISELLAGKEVSLANTAPQGCLIGRVKIPNADSDVTFSNQISRVLNRNCVECHRDGEIGPFALTDYDEVAGWAEMIQEVVDDGRMPPWHADPTHGEFKNSRQMSEADKQLLREWVAAGAPEGDANELPETPSYTSGWQLSREPDAVFEMRSKPVQIPASGTVEYKYFVVDPKFETDRWISSAQVIPGNAAVVHHAIVFVRPPDGARFRGVGWISAYVPGQRLPEEMPGHARFVPAGSKLVFQMHYTPNGQPQEDLTKIGLLFAEEPTVTDELITLVGIDQEFEIPPFADDFAVDGKLDWYPSNGRLLGIVPHMHVRGKSFQCDVTRHDGTETLLRVPKYDFNWQHAYQLEEPLEFSQVSSLNFEARFDNSRANPVNPDPSQFVTWGDQTWEEMAVVFFEVSTPRFESADADAPRGVTSEKDKVTQAKIDKFVDDFFAKFDANNDEQVQRDETSIAFRRFGFWRFDNDGDRQLSREEVRSMGAARIQ